MTVEHDPAKTAPATGPAEQPIPTWQKIAGGAFVAVWAAVVILWHGRAGADFYPLDASRVAPNLLASFIIFSLGLTSGRCFWPPTPAGYSPGDRPEAGPDPRAPGRAA